MLRIPPTANTVHLMGDTHFDYYLNANRRNLLLQDLARPSVPDVAHTFQVGDHINENIGDDAIALSFYQTLQSQTGTALHITYGNHDVGPNMQNGLARTPEQFASLYGIPSPNYTVDVGYAVFIMLGIDTAYNIFPANGTVRIGYDAATLTWLTQVLDATTKPAVIVTHPPLKDTVGVGAEATEISSAFDYWYADPDATIRNIIANNGNLIAWVSGHVHANLTSPNLVKTLTIGSKTVACISTSSLGYTGRTPEWYDAMSSLYLTIYPSSLEVRFRDHGAGQWVSANVNGAMTRVAVISR